MVCWLKDKLFFLTKMKELLKNTKCTDVLRIQVLNVIFVRIQRLEIAYV